MLFRSKRVDALNMVLLAAVVAVPMMLFFGGLSDRIGRKVVFLTGTVVMMAYIPAFFWLLSLKSPMIATVAIVVGF